MNRVTKSFKWERGVSQKVSSERVACQQSRELCPLAAAGC